MTKPMTERELYEAMVDMLDEFEESDAKWEAKDRADLLGELKGVERQIECLKNEQVALTRKLATLDDKIATKEFGRERDRVRRAELLKKEFGHDR